MIPPSKASVLTRCSLRAPAACHALCASLLLASAAVAHAQQAGTLWVRFESGEPVVGATVEVLDSAGSVILRETTDPLGRATLRADLPRRFRVRVDGVASDPWISEELGAAALSGGELALRLPVRPFELTPLTVAARRRCQREFGEAPDALAAFQRAQAAFERIASAESAVEGYVVQLVRERADEKPTAASSGWFPTRGERGVWRDSTIVRVERPLDAPPAEALAERGYAEAIAGEPPRYYAPMPEVLASESFSRTHCFGLVRTDGRITAVRFLPIHGDRVEVRGIIELDSLAEPTRLIFEFTGLAEFLGGTDLGRLVAAIQERTRHDSQIRVGPIRFAVEPFGGSVRYAAVGERRITWEWEIRAPYLREESYWGGREIDVRPHAFDLRTRGVVLEVLRR